MNNQNRLMRTAYGVYFLIAVAFVLIRMLSAFGLLSFLGDYAGYVFTIVIQIVLLLGGSVFLFSAISKNKIKNTLKFYNFNKISWKCIFICILIGVIVFFLNIFVSSFFNAIISALGYNPNRATSTISDYPIWLLFVNIIFTAVLPGICEEIAHRGMLLNTSIGMGRWRAVLLTSLLFGLLHLNIEQVFYATIIGLFLGYITIMTKSIYPAMIVHFMNNALSVFLTFSTVKGLSFGNIFARLALILENNLFAGIIFVILLVILLLYLLVRLTMWLIVENARQKLLKGKQQFEKVMQRELYFLELEKIKNKSEGGEVGRKIELNVSEFEDLFILPNVKIEKDIYAKAFMILSFILLSVLTIFTFIWGVL